MDKDEVSRDGDSSGNKKQNQAWLWNRVEALLIIAYSTQVNERYYFTDKELYSVGMAI
ncbi:hypothetical protein [Candidatus Thiodiazotropha sp. LNASS1]|uniref:hypothetical protein n=1 Tax=Candidatus Thiodiazotropha sp. LNASS1 TaxID=3096260 RepID=UPI0034DFBDA0